jgi:hypothetical protein
VESLLSVVDGTLTASEPAYGRVTNELLAPELGVLDGTYVFPGRPHRARFLVGTTEPATLDAVGTALLGTGRSRIDRLRPTDEWPYVAGLSVEAIARDLSEGTSTIDTLLEFVPSTDGGGAELMARGYRAYARLAGDIVPPMVSRDEPESP